jgi:hypothetical protein
MTYGLSSVAESKVAANLTGSGNGTAFQVDGGGQIHKYSSNTISGTTSAAFTNGGFIINANGTIA